jgi:hypothetical protein
LVQPGRLQLRKQQFSSCTRKTPGCTGRRSKSMVWAPDVSARLSYTVTTPAIAG